MGLVLRGLAKVRVNPANEHVIAFNSLTTPMRCWVLRRTDTFIPGSIAGLSLRRSI
jgi:hypothetical protein